MKNKTGKGAAIFIISMLTLNGAYALSCDSIINEISKDTNKHPESIALQHYQWMDVSWLIKNLGAAEIKNIPNNLVQYEWTCKDQLASTLTVRLAARKIVHVEGQSNSENGSEMFSADIAEITPNTQKKMPVVKPADVKETHAFIHSLQTCTPGTYKVNITATNRTMNTVSNQPDIIATYNILGQRNNHCILDAVIPGKSSYHCSYSQASIEMMIKIFSNPKPPGGKETEDFSKFLQECTVVE